VALGVSNWLAAYIRQHQSETRGSREFVDIMQLCKTWETNPVIQAIKSTLAHQEVSLATIQYFLCRKTNGDKPKKERD
jgi:hypothetical protein